MVIADAMVASGGIKFSVLLIQRLLRLIADFGTCVTQKNSTIPVADTAAAYRVWHITFSTVQELRDLRQSAGMQ